MLETVDKTGSSLAETTEAMRRELFDSLGLIVPVVKWHCDSNMPDNSFQIHFHDLVLPISRGLSIDQNVVDINVSRLGHFDISATPFLHPVGRHEQSLIDANDAEACVDSDLSVYGVGGYMTSCLNRRIRQFAGTFIGESVVANSLDLLMDILPRLVEITRNRWGDLKLTQVFRNLVQNDVSIRDFRTILETLLHVNGAMPIDFQKIWLRSRSVNTSFPVASHR